MKEFHVTYTEAGKNYRLSSHTYVSALNTAMKAKRMCGNAEIHHPCGRIETIASAKG
jgi:hypothetical protein